jgi:uncharacterized protein (DUF2249 family)
VIIHGKQCSKFTARNLPVTTERPTMSTPHTELPLAATHTCTCGEHSADLPELDARAIPHAIRHASIFGALDSLAPGAWMILVAPHDPLPLIDQALDRYGEAVVIDYVQRGPDAWKLRFQRTA